MVVGLSKLFKYILVLTVFVSSFGVELASAFAYSVQELELRFKEADYEQVVDEALDNIRFDPHDKISLEFLKRAKKGLDDLKRAGRYLEEDDLRSALIIYMKLKAKSPQAVFLSKKIAQIQDDLQEQDLAILSVEFEAKIKQAKALIAESNFEQAQRKLGSLRDVLSAFKHQEKIGHMFVRLEKAEFDLKDAQAKLAAKILAEQEQLRISKLLETMKRRQARAKNYYTKGEYKRAQRTLAGMYLESHKGRVFARLKRQADHLSDKVAKAQNDKINADYSNFTKTTDELIKNNDYLRALAFATKQIEIFESTIYANDVSSRIEQIKSRKISYEIKQREMQRSNLIANVKKATANENFDRANKLLDEFKTIYPSDSMLPILIQELEQMESRREKRIAKLAEEKQAKEAIATLRSETLVLFKDNKFEQVIARIDDLKQNQNKTLAGYLQNYRAEVNNAKLQYEKHQKDLKRQKLIHTLRSALSESRISEAEELILVLLKDYPDNDEVLSLRASYDKAKSEIRDRLRKRAKAKALELKQEEERKAKENARLARLEEQRLERETQAKLKEEERQARIRKAEQEAQRKEDLRLKRIAKKEAQLLQKQELAAERLHKKEAEKKAIQEAKEKASRKRKLKARLERQRKERLKKEAAAQAAKLETEKKKAEQDRLNLKVEIDELLWQVESFEAANDYDKALSLIETIKSKTDADKRVYRSEKRILHKRDKELKSKRAERNRVAKLRKEEAKRKAVEEAKTKRSKQEELFEAMQKSFDVALSNDDVSGAQDVLKKMKSKFTDELSQAILMANDSIIRSRQADADVDQQKSDAELSDVKFEAACDDIRRSIADSDFMIARARLLVLKKQNADNAEKLEALADIEALLHKEKTRSEQEKVRKEQQAKLRKIEILIAEDKYDHASRIAKNLLAKYPENKKFINVSKLIEKQRLRLRDLCGERCSQVFAKEKLKTPQVDLTTPTVEEEIAVVNVQKINEIKKTDYKNYINKLERKVQDSIEKDRHTAKVVLDESAHKEYEKQIDDDFKQTLREIKRMINRKEFVKAFDTSMVLKQQYPNNEKVELYHQLSRTHMRHLRLEEAKLRDKKVKEEAFRQSLYDTQLMLDAEKYKEAIASLDQLKKDYPGDKQVFKLARTATIKQNATKKSKRRELKAKIAQRKKERLASKLSISKKSKSAKAGLGMPPKKEVDTRYFDKQILKTQSLIKRHNVDTEVFEREIKMLRSQILKRDLTIADNSLSKIRTVYKAVKGLDKQLLELEKRLDDMAKANQLKPVVRVEESRTDRIDRARKLRNDRTERLDSEIDNYERTIRALVEAEDFEAAQLKIKELKTDSRFGEKAQAVAAEMSVIYKKDKNAYDQKNIDKKLKQILAEAKTLKASGRLQTAKKLLDENKGELRTEADFMRLYERIEKQILRRHEKSQAKRTRRLEKLRKERAVRAKKLAYEKEKEEKRLAELETKRLKEEEKLAIQAAKEKTAQNNRLAIAQRKTEKKILAETTRKEIKDKIAIDIEAKDKVKKIVKTNIIKEKKADEEKAEAVRLTAIEIEKKEERKVIAKKKESKRLAKLKADKARRLKELKRKRELEVKENKRKALAERKLKEKQETEQLKLQNKLQRQEYKRQLSNLATLIELNKIEESKDLITKIKDSYSVDQSFNRLLDRYNKALAERNKELEERRRERRELMKKKNADKIVLENVQNDINRFLEDEEIDNAYSVLDQAHSELVLEDSVLELAKFKDIIDKKYLSLKEKQDNADRLHWADLISAFESSVASKDYTKAREQLLFIKQEFNLKASYLKDITDLDAKFNHLYQSQLQLEQANELSEDTEKFRALLKNHKFTDANKLLVEMQRNYGSQDIISELDGLYRAELSKYDQQKEELRKQRFGLLVNETKGAIAQGHLAKAKERIKLLKTLYLQNRGQLKVIATLDKELANKILANKKQERAVAYARVMSEIDKSMLEREYNLVLSRLAQLLQEFPENRRQIKHLKNDARQRLKAQKIEEQREYELSFQEKYADLNYLIQQNNFKSARSTLNDMFEKFSGNKVYMSKLIAQEEKLYTKELDFYDDDYSKQVAKAQDQLDELLISRDWDSMKKRIRDLQKRFPLEESFVDYIVKMEEAKLEDQHELKQRLRLKIVERLDETSESLRAQHKQDCLVFEAKMKSFSDSLGASLTDSDIVQAYAKLDELYKNAPDVVYRDSLANLTTRLQNAQEELDKIASQQEEERFYLLYEEIQSLIKRNNYYSANHKFKVLNAEYSGLKAYRLKVNQLSDSLYKLKKHKR